MPSSYTASARFTKQATGEGTNVWGNILNSGAFDLIDFAIAGTVTISASGATTLTTANGSTDQARGAILNYTGATAGTLTIPSVSKVYIVRAATADCTVTNGSNSATVVAGDLAVIITNGTGVWKVQSNDFANAKLTRIATPTSDYDAATKKYVDDSAFSSSTTLPGQSGNAGKFITTDGTTASWSAVTIALVSGLQAALDAKEAIADRATAAEFQSNDVNKPLATNAVWTAADFETVAYAATVTLDLDTFFNATITLTGDVTFAAPSNAKPGQTFCIEIVQDGTGSRTATFNSAFKFASGIKTLTTTAGAKDYLTGVVRSSGLLICSLVKAPS